MKMKFNGFLLLKIYRNVLAIYYHNRKRTMKRARDADDI